MYLTGTATKREGVALSSKYVRKQYFHAICAKEKKGHNKVSYKMAKLSTKFLKENYFKQN